MANKVDQLWKQYSSQKAADGTPPTKADSKLRVKHVLESVPYNMKHASDHIASAQKQLGKLDKTDRPLSRKLAKKAAKELHTAERKLSHG